MNKWIKSKIPTSIQSKTHTFFLDVNFHNHQIPSSTNNAPQLLHPNLSIRKKLLENFLFECIWNFSQQNKKTQINYSWMLQRESCREIKIVRLKSFHFAYVEAFNGLLTFRCLCCTFFNPKKKLKQGKTTLSFAFV